MAPDGAGWVRAAVGVGENTFETILPEASA
jgi:hypothetical protein